MPNNQFIAKLKALAKQEGSQMKLARKLGVSPQHICDILKGRRDPGPKLLSALGLQRKVVYR